MIVKLHDHLNYFGDPNYYTLKMLYKSMLFDKLFSIIRNKLTCFTYGKDDNYGDDERKIEQQIVKIILCR
ncbi:hypothetical protein BpHYR1_011296 [Brachionus plicatilis]|uniref:Uncharacterized protein n=1 Tax=Brachionus plicatilis TaxID=10195 RepID=A0A3M7QSU9_BRAPC|nr:hypothetical protein BpHYR1_011296 [Brachionus plicatilis]